jgi:hypothetical protein
LSFLLENIAANCYATAPFIGTMGRVLNWHRILSAEMGDASEALRLATELLPD